MMTNLLFSPAGPEFTNRLAQLLPPPRQVLRLQHPNGVELRWHRETLELPEPDTQQLVVYLPADDATATAFQQLSQRATTVTLQAV